MGCYKEIERGYEEKKNEIDIAEVKNSYIKGFTMTIVMRFYGILREIVGEKLELQYSEIPFIELISEILRKYPGLNEYIVITEKGIEVKGVTILVNGRSIVFLGGEKALIRNGDKIDVLPPLHGG